MLSRRLSQKLWRRTIMQPPASEVTQASVASRRNLLSASLLFVWCTICSESGARGVIAGDDDGGSSGREGEELWIDQDRLRGRAHALRECAGSYFAPPSRQ
jgi:hypothetical protein